MNDTIVTTDADGRLVETRNPPPGITFWMRGDGAFSITYAPPLDAGMTTDALFISIRDWLNDQERRHRRNFLES